MPRSLLLSLLVVCAAPPALAAERRFYSGYAGTLAREPRDLARTYFDAPAVRALIFEMEKGPVGRRRVEQALRGTGFTVEDLLRVRIVREREGLFCIGFNYFTADDMRAVEREAGRAVPSLVRAYLQHRAELDRILDRYPVRTVSRSRLAFVLVAGFALNWDGLAVSSDLGYRKPLLVEGEGFRYSFWASEEVPGQSKKEFYWGSSTFPTARINLPGPAANFAFSSFGDPFSDPRMNFPDLLLTPAAAMTPPVREAATRIGLVHETALGMDAQQVLGLACARELASILFRLREGPASEAEIARAAREPGGTGAYLALLERTGYVARGEDGRFFLLVPVLDAGDRELVEETLRLSRRIVGQWLADNDRGMRAGLASLTALKQGMPFESLFTQIWHELFGLTTRELVHAGLLYDPYGSDAGSKGSFPALWRLSLYDLDPG